MTWKILPFFLAHRQPLGFTDRTGVTMKQLECVSMNLPMLGAMANLVKNLAICEAAKSATSSRPNQNRFSQFPVHCMLVFLIWIKLLLENQGKHIISSKVIYDRLIYCVSYIYMITIYELSVYDSYVS